MEKNNSEVGGTFGFGSSNTDKVEQKKEVVSSPVEEVKKVDVEEQVPTDLDEPYTEERSVTIALVKNYSLYRRVNDKTLPKRRDYIGGSVSASRVLSANKDEVETYFPNIVGLAPNNENFITRVKQYLNNIRIPVDELGKTFNVSFFYNKKADYYKIKKEEEKIEDAYLKANRQDTSKLKAALKEKISRLNVLEGTKCKLGHPIDVEEYLMYRHCLLYNDVAKDVALINSDPSIRFYFKDNQKEADKLKKFRIELNKAKVNYVQCLGDDDLFDAIYIQYCVINGLPIISSLAEDIIERQNKLDKFSTEEPVKFNKLCSDKNVRLMAVIEKLIARGELVRSEFNQNITTVDGEFIGANMKEAVAWFNNPNNSSVVNAFHNRLKNS
jgi:hypothetical protein